MSGDLGLPGTPVQKTPEEIKQGAAETKPAKTPTEAEQKAAGVREGALEQLGEDIQNKPESFAPHRAVSDPVVGEADAKAADAKRRGSAPAAREIPQGDKTLLTAWVTQIKKTAGTEKIWGPVNMYITYSETRRKDLTAGRQVPVTDVKGTSTERMIAGLKKQLEHNLTELSDDIIEKIKLKLQTLPEEIRPDLSKVEEQRKAPKAAKVPTAEELQLPEGTLTKLEEWTKDEKNKESIRNIISTYIANYRLRLLDAVKYHAPKTSEANQKLNKAKMDDLSKQIAGLKAKLGDEISRLSQKERIGIDNLLKLLPQEMQPAMAKAAEDYKAKAEQLSKEFNAKFDEKFPLDKHDGPTLEATKKQFLEFLNAKMSFEHEKEKKPAGGHLQAFASNAQRDHKSEEQHRKKLSLLENTKSAAQNKLIFQFNVLIQKGPNQQEVYNEIVAFLGELREKGLNDAEIEAITKQLKTK